MSENLRQTKNLNWQLEKEYMMRSGFWANYQTKQWFLIDEHEMWLRRSENADRLGIPKEIQQKFSDFRLQLDRNALLQFAICHVSIVRIRGHGETVSFEFAAVERKQPMQLIEAWCSAYAGPYTGIYAFNFSQKESFFCLWKDWKQPRKDWRKCQR